MPSVLQIAPPPDGSDAIEVDAGLDAQAVAACRRTSSVATLPLAPFAYGQPPSPGDRGVDRRDAYLRQARMFASAWP